MTRQATVTETLPDADEFLVWVRRSIADLDMKASHFLVDKGVPGSVNRVRNLVRNPSSLKLGYASRLEREIRQAAADKGVELLPLGCRSYLTKPGVS